MGSGQDVGLGSIELGLQLLVRVVVVAMSPNAEFGGTARISGWPSKGPLGLVLSRLQQLRVVVVLRAVRLPGLKSGDRMSVRTVLAPGLTVAIELTRDFRFDVVVPRVEVSRAARIVLFLGICLVTSRLTWLMNSCGLLLERTLPLRCLKLAVLHSEEQKLAVGVHRILLGQACRNPHARPGAVTDWVIGPAFIRTGLCLCLHLVSIACRPLGLVPTCGVSRNRRNARPTVSSMIRTLKI